MIWFWGRECPHCKQLAPILARLEKDIGLRAATGLGGLAAKAAG